MNTYTHTHTHIHIYTEGQSIHMYIWREREREREVDRSLSLSLSLSLYIYIYIYTHTHTHTHTHIYMVYLMIYLILVYLMQVTVMHVILMIYQMQVKLKMILMVYLMQLMLFSCCATSCLSPNSSKFQRMSTERNSSWPLGSASVRRAHSRRAPSARSICLQFLATYRHNCLRNVDMTQKIIETCHSTPSDTQKYVTTHTHTHTHTHSGLKILNFPLLSFTVCWWFNKETRQMKRKKEKKRNMNRPKIAVGETQTVNTHWNKSGNGPVI